jgi:hypothetical protein
MNSSGNQAWRTPVPSGGIVDGKNVPTFSALAYQDFVSLPEFNMAKIKARKYPLPCLLQRLKEDFERQFVSNMTWSNHTKLVSENWADMIVTCNLQYQAKPRRTKKHTAFTTLGNAAQPTLKGLLRLAEVVINDGKLLKSVVLQGFREHAAADYGTGDTRIGVGKWLVADVTGRKMSVRAGDVT